MVKMILDRYKKNYFRREKYILQLTGISLGDQGNLLYKVYSHIGFYVFNLPYPFIALYGAFGSKMDAVAEIISFNTCATLAIIIIMTVMIHLKKLTQFLDKLEETPFLPDLERGGAEEENILTNWFSLQQKQSIAYYVGVLIFVGTGIILTFIIQISSDNPQNWMFAFGPMGLLNVTNRINYEISWLYQCVGISLLSSKLCPIMIIIYGTLSYACAQLQILQYYLRTIAENSQEKLTTEETMINELKTDNFVSWKYFKPAIEGAISYHLKILDIISETEEIFSTALLFIYLGILAALGVVMYAITLLPPYDPRTLTLGLAAAAMCGFPLPICYWGDQISHESEQVARAAYEIAFIGTDLRFQKSLIMIMARSQKTVRIKAGKFVDSSMITFGWIIQTAFSYFMVIRNVNMKT